jgi:putative spermidine/putrescine transport system ATP-binding protein
MAIADRVAVMNRGRIEQIARPSELYDAPATRFSAGFVGNRNALELPVREGDVWLGEVFRVAGPPGAGEAVAFVRPEDVEVSPKGRGQAATVEGTMFQGVMTRVALLVEADGRTARLYADLPSREASALSPGVAVRVYVEPANVRVFAADA